MRQTAASTIAGRMLTATFLVCVGILAVAYCNAQGLDVVFVPTQSLEVSHAKHTPLVNVDFGDHQSGHSASPVVVARC